MRRGIRTGIATSAVLLYLGVAYDRASEGQLRAAGQAPEPATSGRGVDPVRSAPTGLTSPAPPKADTATPVSPQRALIDQYCIGCHSDRVRSGGLALSELD